MKHNPKITAPAINGKSQSIPAGGNNAEIPRIAICVPHGDMVHADFMHALNAMCVTSLLCGLPFVIVGSRSSIITTVRTNAVKKALADHKPTHILFLDSDMTFDPKTMMTLLSRDKDIVGAAYRKRMAPHNIMAQTLDDKPIDVNTGLVEVAIIPTGCLMIKAGVFDKLKKPYFKLGYDEEREQIIGEDVMFCNEVRAAGYQIWCDVDVSKRMGHVGQKIHWTEEPNE